MEVAGVAHPLRKDAQPFLIPAGQGGAAGGLSAPAAEPQGHCTSDSCTAEAWLLGHKGTGLILFNAAGADGYAGHPGPTCRKGSHEETTFGAIHSIACSWQTVKARAPSPCSLLVQDKMDVTLQPPAHDVLLDGSSPAHHSPSSVGTQPLLPARKVTHRSRQSQS